MSATTSPPYRTKLVPIRDPDGTVMEYLRVPDKADPGYQAHLEEHLRRLDSLLDQMAEQLGITREELADRLSHD